MEFYCLSPYVKYKCICFVGVNRQLHQYIDEIAKVVYDKSVSKELWCCTRKSGVAKTCVETDSVECV